MTGFSVNKTVLVDARGFTAFELKTNRLVRFTDVEGAQPIDFFQTFEHEMKVKTGLVQHDSAGFNLRDLQHIVNQR